MPETADLISSADVVAGAGITYRQMDYYARRGFIAPEVFRGGSRFNRARAPAVIVIARTIGRLTAAGLPLETAADEKTIQLLGLAAKEQGAEQHD